MCAHAKCTRTVIMSPTAIPSSCAFVHDALGIVGELYDKKPIEFTPTARVSHMTSQCETIIFGDVIMPETS